MAKLYFRYGAMGSSKTANALMVKYNYEERGKKVLLAKPSIDTRDGVNIVRSRIGLQSECVDVETLLNSFPRNSVHPCDCIIIDEAQFLSPSQVDRLSDIVDDYGVPVICYGLRADFRNVLFPGSSRLMEIADSIEEIKTICWCGQKATCNARYDETGMLTNGEQIVLGANSSYVAVCRKHYKSGVLFRPIINNDDEM